MCPPERRLLEVARSVLVDPIERCHNILQYMLAEGSASPPELEVTPSLQCRIMRL